MTRLLQNPCECCERVEATHHMEWGEWLCSECCAQAIEEHPAP